MIVTVRFDGVLADRAEGEQRPITASRSIPQGLVLVESLAEQFPIHVLVEPSASRSLVYQWLGKHIRWTAVPWISHLREDETVAESVLRTMGNQSTVLFHVDADAQVIEDVRRAGISAFQFCEAYVSYPQSDRRRAFEGLQQ